MTTSYSNFFIKETFREHFLLHYTQLLDKQLLQQIIDSFIILFVAIIL